MFGLERAALYPIAAAWTGAAMLLTMFHIRLRVGWGASALFTVGPATVITLGALYLVQGKPRGYFFDWLEENLLGRRDQDDNVPKPPHPLHAPQSRA